jgi:hypothetical protein
MNKIIFFLVVIMSLLASRSFADCIINVKDIKGNPVHFVLVPRQNGVKKLESDMNGKLEITNTEYDDLKDTDFRLNFINKLAALIYEQRLTSTNTIPSTQDGYYKLENLCQGPNTNRTFTVPDLKRGLKP